MSPTLRHKNGKLYLDHRQLISEALQSSYLTEPGSTGDTQVFLQDYIGFADNQIVLIEDFGSETAEIGTINGSPSSNNGVVLDSALSRSHPAGSRIYIIDFDQVELSHATTATGSKTTLTTSLMRPNILPASTLRGIRIQSLVPSAATRTLLNTVVGIQIA